MALVINKSQPSAPRPEKPLMCYSCNTPKTGLFTLGVNGRQECADCAARRGRTIPYAEVIDGLPS